MVHLPVSKKSLILWVAYGVACVPLVLVLYYNFLPFGYTKTFTVSAGGADAQGELYLQTSEHLSWPQHDASGTSYRMITGPVEAVFEPRAVLKKAHVAISLEGSDVFLDPLQIEFQPKDIRWDRTWNFTKKIPEDLENEGNAVLSSDACAHFDGTGRLVLPDSADQFESNPFSIYLEWNPEKTEDGQQIIGHYNWEIYQNAENVQFIVGKMNDANGPSYSVTHPIDENFFSQPHWLLAVYSPSEAGDGYIALYVDGMYAGKTLIGSDTIWEDYKRQNLSFGWTRRSGNTLPFFEGCISEAAFVSTPLSFLSQESILKDIEITTQPLVFTVVPAASEGKLERLTVQITEQ